MGRELLRFGILGRRFWWMTKRYLCLSANEKSSRQMRSSLYGFHVTMRLYIISNPC